MLQVVVKYSMHDLALTFSLTVFEAAVKVK